MLHVLCIQNFIQAGKKSKMVLYQKMQFLAGITQREKHFMWEEENSPKTGKLMTKFFLKSS